MEQETKPFFARVAQRLVRITLVLWPADSRQWGEALAAELDAIHETPEIISWSVGGLLLLLRAFASRAISWMKLPPGVGFSSLPPSGSQLRIPRVPRFVTLLLFLVVAALLLLPKGREAVSTVNASWNSFQLSPTDRGQLDLLAARAEKGKDARALAFVALSVPEPDRALVLADRAVELDPSIDWIYASRSFSVDAEKSAPQRLQIVSASDAQNAVPYLLAADETVSPQISSIVASRSLSHTERESLITSNPRWLALMHKAFLAPRYDDYSVRSRELCQEIWTRQRDLSPAVLASALWSHRFPDLIHILTFASYLGAQARLAQAAGHNVAAEQFLQEASVFAGHISQSAESDLERSVGLKISADSSTELSALYSNTGRSTEAKIAQIRGQQATSQMHSRESSFRGDSFSRDSRPLRMSSALVQCSALLAFIALITTIASLLTLEARSFFFAKSRFRFQSLLYIVADFAPLTLVLSSISLVVAFQPFARIFDSFRAGSPTTAQLHALTTGVFALCESADAFNTFFNPYFRWLIFTTSLSVLALFLIVHAVLPARTQRS